MAACKERGGRESSQYSGMFLYATPLRADALKALDETLDNMNGALTHIGGVQNTLELAMNANSDRQLQNQSLISGLEDVDFASAVTKFTMMQAQSQASHKAFAMVGRASLFDYI